MWLSSLVSCSLVVCLLGLSACRSNQESGKELHPFVRAVEKRADLGRGLMVVNHPRNEEIASQKATIKTKAPRLVGGETPHQVFNQAMSDYVAEQIKVFKDDFKAINEDAQPAAGAGPIRGSIEIDYRVLYGDQNLVSILFNTMTYMGGPHPNGTSKAFNYDLRNQRLLTLGELFAPNTNYLQTIADYCMKAIKERQISDDDRIRQGAGAGEENYRNWNIEPQGLLINFDPYQVAAYAAGPQEVRIPYSALKGMIRPDGPLSGLVK